MSNEKLSELKAVADYWRKVKSGELPAPRPNEISITVCTLDAAVSRIAALLAELESKSAYAADWCHLATKRKDELEDANKRIAELEAIRSDASQVFKEIGSELGCDPDNESIMVAVDDLKATQMTGPLKDVLKRNIELEAKLATPVRLPPLMDGGLFGKNSATANAHNNAITACSIAIRGTGFKSEVTAPKCVGDE